jgi:hypothetical protein
MGTLLNLAWQGIKNPWVWGPLAGWAGFEGAKSGLGALSESGRQLELPDQLDPDEWAWWQWAKEQADLAGLSALEWLESTGWVGVTPEQEQKIRSQALKEMNPDWHFEDKKTAALRTPSPVVAAEEEEDPWDSYLNSAMMASLGQAMIGKTATPAPVSLSGPASASWTEPMPMASQTDYRYI